MIAKQKEIVVLKEMNKTFLSIMNDNLDSISKVHIIMSLMLINVILSLISYTKSTITWKIFVKILDCLSMIRNVIRECCVISLWDKDSTRIKFSSILLLLTKKSILKNLTLFGIYFTNLYFLTRYYVQIVQRSSWLTITPSPMLWDEQKQKPKSYDEKALFLKN